MNDGEMAQLGRAVLQAAVREQGDRSIGQLARSVLDGEISLRGAAELPYLADDLARGFSQGLAHRDEYANDPMLRELTRGRHGEGDKEPTR